MSVKTMFLAGAAGLAALAGFAAPAAAQYYPGYPGSGYPGYGYNNNNVLGAIVGQVLGYGQYPYGNYGYNQYGNQRLAVDQCARAVEARIGGNRGGYYGYGNVPYGGGYGSPYGGGYGYNQGYGGGRVLGITRVDRKSYGLKVYGVASSGYNGYDGYGRRGYGSYGYSNGADLSWNCEVRYDGRIRDIDVNRRSANWRGY
jgi:hypothetical protein